MYKKVYIEITNNCNLNCSFCIKNKREPKNMTLDEFKTILTKLKGVTKYLYFHILGEPLIHPQINEFINLASQDFYVNITTNGYFIKNIINNKNIRQLNISLHSFNEVNKKSAKSYMEDIFEVTKNLKSTTYINYRIWHDINPEIKSIFASIYGAIDDSKKLEKNVYLSISKPFTWPDLTNDLDNNGKCLGLNDHFGILSNGTIIPCCLDSKADIPLGNIFTDNLLEVLNKSEVINLKEELKNGIRKNPLCRHCGFSSRQNK